MKAKARKHAHKQDTTKRYSATKKGMFWFNNRNQWVPLSNFTAKIRADITKDDGAGGERLYELEVTLVKEKGSQQESVTTADFRRFSIGETFGRL